MQRCKNLLYPFTRILVKKTSSSHCSVNFNFTHHLNVDIWDSFDLIVWYSNYILIIFNFPPCPDQSRCDEDGPGMLQVDLRRVHHRQGRGAEVNRDFEDRHFRKDLRRGREGQADSQVGKDVRKRRSNCKGRIHNARTTSNFMFGFLVCLELLFNRLF